MLQFVLRGKLVLVKSAVTTTCKTGKSTVLFFKCWYKLPNKGKCTVYSAKTNTQTNKQTEQQIFTQRFNEQKEHRTNQPSACAQRKAHFHRDY